MRVFLECCPTFPLCWDELHPALWAVTWRVGPDLRMHRTGVDYARIPISVRMSMVFRRGYGTSGIVVPNVTGISLTISSLYERINLPSSNVAHLFMLAYRTYSHLRCKGILLLCSRVGV